MSNQIVPFDFGEHHVRVIVLEGDPWFVLADLCNVLEISNVGNVAARLDDDVKGIHTADTPGGRQQMTIVSEAGMYEVVLLSRKPEARAFKRWVTGAVLPQIRRTGSYGAQEALSEDEIVHQALAITVARVEALTADVAALTPRAESWDQLADSSGTYTVTDAGKLLASAGCQTGPRLLFQQLAGMGWIFKRSGIWTGKQDKINAGLLAEYAGSHFHPRTGERVLDAPTVRVTVEGLGQLREFFGGAEPLIEVTP
ncbi:phage antirepressor [Leucobacter allii]|uniref:Phage antirepressor n=1 Tax=Leucobacter allii TaxID=2932247 RepID=A0ABY4FPG7_9MICO|nr:phage antirepressor [Leucobacter allii]UOQ58131.1 phage antirepressor [Leucobacter allii]